jgi:hypothetical protein
MTHAARTREWKIALLVHKTGDREKYGAESDDHAAGTGRESNYVLTKRQVEIFLTSEIPPSPLG